MVNKKRKDKDMRDHENKCFARTAQARNADYDSTSSARFRKGAGICASV